MALRSHPGKNTRLSWIYTEEKPKDTLRHSAQAFFGVRWFFIGRLLEFQLVENYGNSRIRMLRNSIGDPSASRQRYPLDGLHSLPPETSSPLTHKRSSPLIART